MSKKILLSIFILILTIFSVVYATKIDTINYDGADHKYTGPEVTLNLNGDKFEVTEGLMPPIILDDRTLVPVREVFEVLGGEVNWDAKEARVDVTLGAKEISLWINNKDARVDGKTITTDVPAKIINSKTMVPARFISEQGGLNVEWDGETQTVGIMLPKATITNVEYKKINDINCLVVNADSAISGYKYFMLNETEPYRLILDVENSKFKFDTSAQTIDDDLLSTVRFGIQENNINRIVLDLKKDTDYIVVQSQDKTKLYYAMASEFEIPGEENIVSGEVNKEDNVDITNKPNNDEKTENKPDNVEIPENKPEIPSGDKNQTNNNDKVTENSGDINEVIGKSSGDSDVTNNNSGDNSNSLDKKDNENNLDISGEKNNNTDENNKVDDNQKEENNDENQNIIIPDVYITSIKYSTVSKRIKIAYDGELEFKDNILSNPDRIVIDIQNAELKTEGPKEFSLKNNIITSVRFSQYETDAVRVVLDLSERADYKITKRSSELQVSVTQPTYRNISYKLNSTNAQITLHNVNEDDIKVTRSEKNNKYTLKFDSDYYDCGEGIITPNDDFVERINITETRINIYDTGDMVYTMRQSGSNVIITIKKEETEDESIDKKIILIDPGHGGSDPGACNGSAQEKVYNLNISLMLYDLLSERDDVKVYMSRDSDTYLNREDRLEIATKINPDLIVSVHNNSLENKSYTGTMVLYYNNDTESQYGDITSKECAQIVLNKLINALDTVNRGVVNRQDLHILSKTPCPSILCEISFVSNDAELERLKTKTFQEDAAQAIYDGVVEILKIM